MPPFQLMANEAELLMRQDPNTETEGGFQSLLVKLQRQFNVVDNMIVLDADDLERIPRYAFDYGNGGWENRLVGVFGRVLGARLGRQIG